MILILAQIAEASTAGTVMGMDNGLLGGLLGAAGGVGFAIWYGYHVTTKTIPNIVGDFREERKLDREERRIEREEFSEALGKITDAVTKAVAGKP